MEDRSVIKPVIDALEYFIRGEEEIQFFYKIIDKFCAKWFNNKINAAKFDKTDIFLIHEMLGEYLRFESNNKRVALWLLAINRVSYNFTVDLSNIKKELKELEKSIDDNFDNSLILPILSWLVDLENMHNNVNKENLGLQDITGNFLQWVGLYTTYIYPSLENKLDIYDKKVTKAMNYLLMEFIKQKSNDKRLAFLLLAIIEACKQYSLQNSQVDKTTIINNKDMITAGSEEILVEELLNKLKEENEKQRQRPVLTKEIQADQFVKDSLDDFIDNINFDVNEAVSIFNNYTSKLTNKLITFDHKKQYLFFQTLYRYRANCQNCLKESVYYNLKNSVKMLSSHTKIWLEQELENINQQKDLYIDYILQKLKPDNAAKINTAKLFIMLYLIKKFNL